MGKSTPEGSRPERTQTMFGRVGNWISSKVEAGRDELNFIDENCARNEVFSWKTITELSQGFRESMEGALEVVNAGWNFVTGKDLTAQDIAVAGTVIVGGTITVGGVTLALAPGTAHAGNHLFVQGTSGPVLVDLDASTSSSLSSGLYPTGTTYGLAMSGFHDANADKTVLSYSDISGDTGSEGLLVAEDLDGVSPTSALTAFDNDPGKVEQNPDTGSVTFGDDVSAKLCTDYEDAATCDEFPGGTVVAFAADEDGTGRGVILYESSGFDVIDLATGTIEYSDTMIFPSDVVIDRSTGHAFVADTMGMEMVTIDLNAGTPSEVSSETFSFGPTNLLLYTNTNTGNQELAVVGYYTTTELEFFEVSGSALTSVGTETHADTIGFADVVAVDDIDDAGTMYIANAYAGEVLGLDLSTYSWDGSSYASAYGAASVIYIPETAVADPCDDHGGDADEDGVCADDDCNDLDATAWEEIEGIEDADGDGFGYEYGTAVSFCAATLPSGYVDAAYATDCDDTDPLLYDYANWALDYDGDGFGDNVWSWQCGASGYYTATVDSDCDDGDAGVFPGATETCDGDLEDCDLPSADYGLPTYTYYRDEDGDGFGVDGDTYVGCGPSGFYTATVGGDWDDTESTVYPGAPEIYGDGLDNDGDGLIDYQCEFGEDGDWSEPGLCHVEIAPGVWIYANGEGSLDLFEDGDDRVLDVLNGELGMLLEVDRDPDEAQGEVHVNMWGAEAGIGGTFFVMVQNMSVERDWGDLTWDGSWGSDYAWMTTVPLPDGLPHCVDLAITFEEETTEIDDALCVVGGVGEIALVSTETGEVDQGVTTSDVVDEYAEEEQNEEIDSDGDGVPDDEDKCPDQDASGFDVDGDGCIDDTDGDGVLDPDDACPNEDATGQDADGDGCIDDPIDSDGDGIPDDEDDCPEEYAAAEEDLDGDGCIDPVDTDDDDNDSGDTADDDTDTPGGCHPEGGDGGCSTNPSKPLSGLPLVLPIAGLYLSGRRLRRRRERKAVQLSDMSPDQAAFAYGQILGDQMANAQEER